MSVTEAKSIGEIEAVSQIIQEVIPDKYLYGSVYTSPFLSHFLYYQYQHKIDVFLIFKVGSNIAGAIQYRDFGNRIHLNNIVIKPEFQGRKIGKLLLEELIIRARTKNLPLSLDVNNNNVKAIDWYKRLGFLEVGCTSNNIFDCFGEMGAEDIFLLKSSYDYQRFGFSEVSINNGFSYFFVKNKFVRVIRDSINLSDEIQFIMEAFNGYLIVEESFSSVKIKSKPLLVQSYTRMELK